jgi:hypothetical protein
LARQQLSAPTGDFDYSGIYDANDLDLMIDALGGGDLSYDLTGDMTVDQDDLDYLLVNLFETGYGDADLDGTVGIADLEVLIGNWHETGKHWAHGNWNGEGGTDYRVDLTDLGILAENWDSTAGKQADPSIPLNPTPGIPEPTALALLGLGVLTMLRRRN